jgi:hypothetical protein
MLRLWPARSLSGSTFLTASLANFGGTKVETANRRRSSGVATFDLRNRDPGKYEVKNMSALKYSCVKGFVRFVARGDALTRVSRALCGH